MWDDMEREFDRSLVESMEALKIGAVDFTLDDVLDKAVNVDEEIEPPKDLTGTPSSVESSKLEDARKIMLRDKTRTKLQKSWTGYLYPVTKPSTIPHAFLISQYTWHQGLGHQGSEVLHRILSSNLIPIKRLHDDLKVTAAKVCVTATKLKRTIDQSASGKLRDLNAEESWALLEDLALYDNESRNEPRDFAKPVKAIALPQDVLSTSDHRSIELKNQVQRLMEAHLDLTQPT
ncbi:hypothetical protein Tco_0218415 [Tanacetum coccineum]